MPTSTPKIDSGSTFMVTNLDDHTLTFSLPKRKFIIEPSKRIIDAPFDLVRIYFGDPRSINGTRRMFDDSTGKGTIATREEEVERLKTHYGVYGEDTCGCGCGQPIKAHSGDGVAVRKTLTYVAPKVRVQTTDGDDLYPPILDRKGEKGVAAAPLTTDDLNTVTSVNALIAKQQGQLEELMKWRDSVKVNGKNTTPDVGVDVEEEEFMQVSP